MKLRAVVSLGVLLALAGCTRTPPAQYYVLAAPAGESALAPRTGALIGLGPIGLPGYLDRPQIVTRSSENRLELAASRRWAEPFEESFKRALYEQLAALRPELRFLHYPWKASPPVTARIVLDVQRFDRGSDGAVTLLARWSVASGTEAAPAQRASRISVPVAGKADDYDALVAAHGQAIALLAKDIAGAVAP